MTKNAKSPKKVNTPPSIIELVNAGYAAQPASKWPTYNGGELDRTAFITSSEVGNCARMIWFGKHTEDYTPTEGDEPWGYFARGHNVEAWVVEQLERSALDCLFVGQHQRSFYHDNQSGTPDGIVCWGGVWYCLEIKSIDPRTNTRMLPKAGHVLQTQQNMDLINACMVDQDIQVFQSLLLYVDASNYRVMQEFVIDADVSTQEQLEEKAATIAAAKSPDELPPEGLYNSGCGYCTFTAHCSEVVQKKKELSKDAARQKLIAEKLF